MKVTIVDFVRETRHTLEGDPTVIEHWIREQYPEDFLLIKEGDLYSLLNRLADKYGVGVALLDGKVYPIPGRYPLPDLPPEDPNSEELAELPATTMSTNPETGKVEVRQGDKIVGYQG